MQQSLFNKNEPIKKSTGLIISKNNKKHLTKNQLAFNKLTQRIEKLQKDIEKKQLQFDLALKTYSTELYPVQLKMLEKRRQLILVLFEIYNRKNLSKTNQRALKAVLKYHVQEYFTMSEIEPDTLIQQVFTAVEGMDYNEIKKQEKEEMEAYFKSMFDKLNVNIEGVDLKDEATLAAKIAEATLKQSIIEEEQAEKAAEKIKKKQQKYAPKEIAYQQQQQTIKEVKQKNISTIYKQLAKLFHPDLEQDDTKKLEKEILMKELISAYQAKNLHALLSLELKWIHKENDHLESLTDEKLSVYLQILREQASEMEYEKSHVIEQPQYAVLLKKFGYLLQKTPLDTIKFTKEEYLNFTTDFERDIEAFESETALKQVNQMLKQWKIREHELDEEELIRMLFG